MSPRPIILAVVLVPLVASARPKTVHREVDAKTAYETFVYHRKDGFRHFRVLDARPAEKRAEAIPGSITLPVEAAARRAALEKLPSRGVAYLVYCGDGTRSAAVMGEMKDLFFVEVYSLKGGFPAWKRGGYPVTKVPTPKKPTN
jgi:rhodanese-related sulfurtransferase